MHISKSVNPEFGSKIANIFRAYYSLKETSVLSFDDVVFSKGGFLDDKNIILLIVEKFAFVLKGLTYDSDQKFQIIFWVYVFVKGNHGEKKIKVSYRLDATNSQF